MEQNPHSPVWIVLLRLVHTVTNLYPHYKLNIDTGTMPLVWLDSLKHGLSMTVSTTITKPPQNILVIGEYERVCLGQSIKTSDMVPVSILILQFG